MDGNGLISRPVSGGVNEVTSRLAAAVTSRGMTVLARIDHGAAAKQVGLELRPTEVLIFGNPKAGTPLMQHSQLIGIDLPLKALVWEDEHGVTWLAYNDPAWIAERHGLVGVTDTIEGMLRTLTSIVDEIAS